MAKEDPTEILQSLDKIFSKFEVGNLEEAAKSGGPVTVNNLDQVVAEMKENIDRLQKKAEDLQKRTGMSKEELEAYVENPDNFSKEEWEVILRIRGALDSFKKQMWSLMKAGPEVARGKPTAPTDSSNKKPGRPKRQHWIPS